MSRQSPDLLDRKKLLDQYFQQLKAQNWNFFGELTLAHDDIAQRLLGKYSEADALLAAYRVEVQTEIDKYFLARGNFNESTGDKKRDLAQFTLKANHSNQEQMTNFFTASYPYLSEQGKRQALASIAYNPALHEQCVARVQKTIFVSPENGYNHLSSWQKFTYRYSLHNRFVKLGLPVSYAAGVTAFVLGAFLVAGGVLALSFFGVGVAGIAPGLALMATGSVLCAGTGALNVWSDQRNLTLDHKHKAQAALYYSPRDDDSKSRIVREIPVVPAFQTQPAVSNEQRVELVPELRAQIPPAVQPSAKTQLGVAVVSDLVPLSQNQSALMAHDGKQPQPSVEPGIVHEITASPKT